MRNNTDVYLMELKKLEEMKNKIMCELITIHLHPSSGYNKMEKIENELQKKGWVVINKMVPYESYHGYGTDLVKAKSDLTKFDRDFLDKHDCNMVY